MPHQTKIRRHPLEAKAVGILQNGRRKMNIFSILWSDQNDLIIYRSFDDFKKMHRELTRKFPLESGLLRKSDNMVPKLRDVPIFRKNRSSSRFIERLRLLEKFCQELLNADDKISQCDVVTKFLAPTNTDLNATFPENSIVIMPSEVREPQKRVQPKQSPQPPASEPIVSQMYLCIEDYETKDTKNQPFKVKCNEKLGVLIKENSGWWLVENEDKRVAWFPAPFLKAIAEREDSDSGIESDDEGVRYYATSAYEAMSCDELSLSRGVLVEVMEKSDNGWWLIRYNGKTGFAPAMYLKPYQNCHQLEAMMNQGNFSSMVNLFKASSTLELDRSEESWRKEDNHSMVDDAKKSSKSNLDRRKSRSIGSLPLNTHYGFQRPPTETPSETDNVMASSSRTKMKLKCHRMEEVSNPPLTFNQPIAIQDPSMPQLTKITLNAQVVGSSPSGPKASSVHPNSHLVSGVTPRVPQRPRRHEILNKCTSATRTALKKREGMLMHS
ncbi:hypothetical protein GDO78_002201 [Eleutherodactylus coqui]|uniref:NADPH oxidase organizer 1 n=1 Tax=Eleutherodactylus coqui TaxID=57060 RepID=A0A8J6K216_ELECQ|nr:hypothetical protein GDO78_002201 [Eleutherodactylus coqui]